MRKDVTQEVESLKAQLKALEKRLHALETKPHPTLLEVLKPKSKEKAEEEATET